MSAGGRKSLTEPVVVDSPAVVPNGVVPKKHAPVRGKPVSGRVWKDDLGLPERYVIQNWLFCEIPIYFGP